MQLRPKEAEGDRHGHVSSEEAPNVHPAGSFQKGVSLGDALSPPSFPFFPFLSPSLPFLLPFPFFLPSLPLPIPCRPKGCPSYS